MRGAAAVATRRWRRVIPLVFVTYSLAFLDRSNFGIAAANGMARDLGIGSRANAWVAAVFFLGYFLFQVPGVIYAERHGVRKLVFGCLVVWGAAASLTGIVTSVPALLAVRFLLGAAEAAVLPAMLVYLARWFSRSERSRANSLLILGNPVTVFWMSVASGYLAAAFGWRWMFIIEGAPAALWAFLWWSWSDEGPGDARWLPESERSQLESDLEGEQTRLGPVKDYLEAFRSPVLVCLCAHYFFWSFGTYGFVIWLPSIVKHASNLGIVGTSWLSALPYLLAVPAMIVTSACSDRRSRRVPFVWPFLLAAAAAFFGCFLLGVSHPAESYGLLVVAGICMYAPFGPFFAIVPETLPLNVAGGAMALVNSIGALGGFAGSYLVNALGGASSDDPSVGFALMGLALVLAGALIGAVPRLDPIRANGP